MFVVVVVGVHTPGKPRVCIYMSSGCVVQAPTGWALLTCTYAFFFFLLRRAAMAGETG